MRRAEIEEAPDDGKWGPLALPKFRQEMMFFETSMSWAGNVSGVLCRYLREEGESAFLCLVSALVSHASAN